MAGGRALRGEAPLDLARRGGAAEALWDDRVQSGSAGRRPRGTRLPEAGCGAAGDGVRESCLQPGALEIAFLWSVPEAFGL